MSSAVRKAGIAKIAIVVASVLGGWVSVYSGVALGQTSGPVYTTTGIYDEQVTNEGNNLMNAVDAIAAGTNVGLTGLVSAGADALTIMAPHFQTAYDNNAGGVISFDLVAAPSNLTDRFFGVYGVNNLFLMSVVRRDPDGVGGLNSNSDNPTGVISGHNYLGISNGSNFDIFFSQPLIEFGITAVSRGAERTGVMTIRYTDNTTYVFPPEVLGATGDDTFFGHLAPNGKLISGYSWVSQNSLLDPTPNDGLFVRWDDLGFSTSNLAPCDVDGLNGCTTADADIIRQHLLETGVGRSQGDITGDGIVNLLDFKLWKSLAGSGSGGLGVAGAVPEPNSVLLLLLGAAGGLGWRRSRR